MDQTQTRLNYAPDDHRVDISGRPLAVNDAAYLLERASRFYQYSGLHVVPKRNANVLGADLSACPSLYLVPCSRPAATPYGPVDAFLLAPPSAGPDGAPSPSTSSAAAASSLGAAAATTTASGSDSDSDAAALADGGGGSSSRRQQQPGASTSTSSRQPLLLHTGRTEAELSALLDAAIELSLRHPARCAATELRFYLGKLLFTGVLTSQRLVGMDELLDWTYPANGRTVFETAVPQDTVRDLDAYLTAAGFEARQQSTSVSIHLESGIPWIQYNPTFAVQPDGTLRMAKLEGPGCKPLTVALLGGPNRLDVRLRYVASVQYGDDDEVAAQLRLREGAFELRNRTQVIIPSDLYTLDLRLASARVKLKRVYVTPQPATPPTPAAAAPAPRKRGRKAAAATAAAPPAPPPLPAVTLKVSVAAVVDNLGGKRLEVTVACPELNDTLLAIHAARQLGPGARAALEAQLRSVMAHLDALRAAVPFVP